MAGRDPPYNARMTTGLLCYCRAGFEPELAGELTDRASEAGLGGYARTERGSGYAVFLGEDADALVRALPFDGLIFARQKLRLIAEGVEDERQRDFLASYGCHAYQGYLFGMPMDQADMRRYLQDRSPLPPALATGMPA